MSMDINIIKKKILNLINVSMNIRRKTYNALKHNLWATWMTALIMWTLILTSVFITITYFIYIHILNEQWRRRECCSQLVRWTLNWNKGRNIEQNIFSELSAWVSLCLSLSSPLQSCCCSHLNSSVLVFNSKLVIILFPFFIILI